MVSEPYWIASDYCRGDTASAKSREMARRFRRRIEIPTKTAINWCGAGIATELGYPFQRRDHRPASADYRPKATSTKAGTRNSTGEHFVAGREPVKGSLLDRPFVAAFATFRSKPDAAAMILQHGIAAVGKRRRP